MSITWTLYERWKALRPELSVMGAAKELGVSHTAIAFWRDGRNASAAVLERLCNDLGEDFARVIAVAWAEGARDEKDRKALLRLAKRFRGTLAAMAVALVPLLSAPTVSAHSGPSVRPNVSGTIHYANTAPHHGGGGKPPRRRARRLQAGRPSRRSFTTWRTYRPASRCWA